MKSRLYTSSRYASVCLPRTGERTTFIVLWKVVGAVQMAFVETETKSGFRPVSRFYKDRLISRPAVKEEEYLDITEFINQLIHSG